MAGLRCDLGAQEALGEVSWRRLGRVVAAICVHNGPVGCRGKRGSVVFLEALHCGVGGLIKACRGSSEQSAREACRHVLHMSVTWRRQVRQRALHYSCNSHANMLTHASLWQAARPLSALWYQQGGVDSPHGSQGPKMKQI